MIFYLNNLISAYPGISIFENAITRHSLCFIPDGHVSFRPFNINETNLIG